VAITVTRIDTSNTTNGTTGMNGTTGTIATMIDAEGGAEGKAGPRREDSAYYEMASFADTCKH
jgi:hypothetical protein